MADISTTQDAFTQDQMMLRRRARRRLVGAIAIALAAVLLLPMLFDPEPRPLGPDVDIRIPAPSTPFDMAPAATAVAPEAVDDNEPPPVAAEPTQSALKPSAESRPEATDSGAAGKTETRKTEAKIAEKPPEPAREKAAVKPTPAPAPLPKPSGAFASQGFYLQLGAFTSETNARQLREKAEAAGFKVGLADSNGQYRVRVGPIPEKDRALEMQSRLKAKGFNSIMLGP